MPRPAHKFDLKDIEEGHAGLWRIPAHPLKVSFRSVVQDVVGHTDFHFAALFAAEAERRLPGTDPEEFMPYGLRDETGEEREALRRKHEAEAQELARRRAQAEQELQINGKPMELREDLREVYVRMGEEKQEELRQLLELSLIHI